jgi:hypothetical protein
LLAAAEAMRLPHGKASDPLIVVYVVLAFLGQAAIADLVSGFIPENPIIA